MSKMTSTGVAISVVHGTPATFDQAGYEALTYTGIAQVTNIPEFGPTISVVESNPLATGITEKFVGFINNGSTSIEADYDEDDAGQAVAATAVLFGSATFGEQHSFKIAYPSGEVRYFVGKFFSATENPGSANSMVTSTMNVEIDTVVLKIASV